MPLSLLLFQMKTYVLLLSMAVVSHDIVQASLNAWGAQFDEVKLLNVNEENKLELLKEELKALDNNKVIIADASVMPLRNVPDDLMTVPFLYANKEDRYMIPFICLASDAVTILDNRKVTSIAQLRMELAQLAGHEFPIETDWQHDPLLLPVASKEPNENLLKQFVEKKYFVRFKQGCVSEKTIQLMRRLFPPQVKREEKEIATEVQPAGEGEKKEDDDNDEKV